ncbi:MAG: hypothetical protein IJL83_01325 [Clostridia bacterium]|nr:hypothetical protein [Clostridia bacterium]
MKILKRLVPLLLIAALLFSLAACDRIVGPRGKDNNRNTSSQSTEDPRFVKQPGQGMSEYDVYSYFENCYYPACWAVEYYGGKGLDYVESETIELDGHTWAPSAVSTFQTLESMTSYVEMFFTGGFLDNLKHAAGMSGDSDVVPRYRDVDGKLYVRTDEPNESMFFSIDLDTFTMVENTEEQIKFTVDAALDGKLYELRVILSPYGESGWKMSYWYPEEKDASSESSQ